MDQLRPTLVNNRATMGSNLHHVCGHNIGRYAFVGAGGGHQDVPDYALVVGQPGPAHRRCASAGCGPER